MGVNDGWGMANSDPRGMVGMISVGDYYALLHTINIEAVGLNALVKIFKLFPIIDLWNLITNTGQLKLEVILLLKCEQKTDD